MPMNQQARAQHVRKLPNDQTRPTSGRAKQFAKEMPRAIRSLRNHLQRLDRRFQQIDGVDAAAKQTALFDTISAETDGSLILHDLAQFLDAATALANDNRQPNDSILAQPFTDADVDAYEA